MKMKAEKLGQEIIHIEKVANEGFANRSITDEILEQLILKSGEIYGQLRYIHLSTHLKMMDILSLEQVDLYNQLRGYSIKKDHSH
jgi:hypothetical protein